MQPRIPHCRRGFTLIELLIVLAIIAILASLAFPTFYRLSAESKALKCVNNLSKSAQALQKYVGTFGGFPLLQSRARGRWYSALDPQFTAVGGVNGPWTCPIYRGPVTDGASGGFMFGVGADGLTKVLRNSSTIGRGSYGQHWLGQLHQPVSIWSSWRAQRDKQPYLDGRIHRRA